MDGCCHSPMCGKPSARHRSKPLEGSSFEVADFSDQIHVHAASDEIKCCGEQSNKSSSGNFSTPELVSAIGQIWDSANRSLALLQPKRNVRRTDRISHRDDLLWYSGGKLNPTDPGLANSTYVVDLTPASGSCCQDQGLDCLRLSRKICSESCGNNFLNSFLLRNLCDISFLPDNYLKKKGLVAISHDLRKAYEWMSQIPPSRAKFPVTSMHVNEKTIECSGSTDTATACGTIRANETSILSDDSEAGSDSYCQINNSNELSFSAGKEVFTNPTTSVSSLYSDYFLPAINDSVKEATVARISSPGLYADYHVNISSSSCSHEQFEYKAGNNELSENKMNEYEGLDTEDEPRMEIHSPKANIVSHRHPKQEHAVSGALAGTFVSLCLHPVDTIKTVIQSCQAHEKSIFAIGRSIISERGLMGLYRGITSNIATSAPISAIYTFTYETVKGSLLPFLPKDYHSFAHCTAGGCASIATSFVFTPSERIKQQMQVSLHYENCWNAFFRIIERGGLPSLYAGWGAVLCRNIPHSIIKFYTYESLKQLILSSQCLSAQPNTLQTLLCGALAGSTAALFSTPFDVVKTRLQTQIPGSTRRYHSVFSALEEISRHEGIKGLYRGLTPRLIMYMSQGALFFSSYEFFKRLFCVKFPEQNSRFVQYERELNEASMLSLSPSQ
ncbi:hypothetical protein Ancab_014765 [Ancistrocladus abbreviatus]